MDLSSPYLYTPSALSLLAFNLVPLLGALFWGWSQGELLLLYWSESGIIGFYTILKMLIAQGVQEGTEIRVFHKKVDMKEQIGAWGTKAFLVTFFMVHFGGFMAGHLVFILALFIGDAGNDPIAAFINVLPAFLGLFLSHGISFITNFIQRDEYKKAVAGQVFASPYGRIVMMHVAIIFGAIIQSPLLILVLAKTAFDLDAHVQERQRFSAGRTS